jgi:integrase
MLEALDIARVESKGMRRRVQDIKNLWGPVLRILGATRDAGSLTIDDATGYEGSRRAEKHHDEQIRGQTVRRELQALRRGLGLAEKSRLIHRDPINWRHVDTVQSDPPSVRRSGKLWTADEIEAVFSKLSKKAICNGVRDRLRLIQLTGLRLEELRRLEPSWVRDGALFVPHTGSKTRQPRMIPLGDEAITIIDKWQTFDMRSPNRSLKLASATAGFAAVLTPRDLRVFYITHAGRSNLAAARDLAGHTNIATTSRYLKSDLRSLHEAAQEAQKAAGVPTRRSPQRNRSR